MGKKAVLISIHPEWCGKIFDGRKNLGFRKIVPNIEPPFKCYVYCTARKQRLLEIIKDGDDVYGTEYHGEPIFIKTSDNTPYWLADRCKKVIGEVTVDLVQEVTVKYGEDGNPVGYYGASKCKDLPDGYLLSGGFTLGDYMKYKGKGQVFGWHISDYKLFDKPMEVSDFRFHGCTDRVKKPPQSIVYVNELEG